MSKYRTIDVWNEFFGNKENVYDYAGRLMKKSACGDPNSAYHPTLDHIRPLREEQMFSEISKFAIVIPTRKKQIASLTGKRTENAFGLSESKEADQNMKS